MMTIPNNKLGESMILGLLINDEYLYTEMLVTNAIYLTPFTCVYARG